MAYFAVKNPGSVFIRAGDRVTRYLEQRGIGWVAWCFDPEWGPQLLKNFDGFELTGSGEFFKQALHRAPVPVEPRPAPKW